MSSWYACLMTKEMPLQPPTMAIFIMPTTEPVPTMPTGSKLLGRVRSDRKGAIEEAIDYLKAARLVEESDEIARSIKR